MLNDFDVPDYLERDHRDIIKEEEREYDALQNKLIELEFGAFDGIKLLKREVMNSSN